MAKRWILMCLAGVLLVPASARAQAPEPLRSAIQKGPGTVDAAGPMKIRVGVGRLTTAVATLRRMPTQLTRRPRSARTGLIIGLAAGTAAAALYWTARGCHHGSDSTAAIVAQCVIPSAGMTVGGGLLGMRLGR